ncbi:MAG TPA: bile acid:sodium symporter family protein [Mucilaginibacter sp.]|nr:bile acid:sodium symporter family protein [Mucilaginibacter sp.]
MLKKGLIVAAALFLMFIVLNIFGNTQGAGWILTLFFASLAVAFQGSPALKSFTFTAMIFAATSAAMYYPQYFLQWGNFKLSALILPFLQVIMFGMGTELSLKELMTVIRMPRAILVGVICHYTIMPLVGYALATVFNFPKEIAAGIILVGCCPSGLASNVMAYLGRANLALSIAVTAISNLLAPLLTPLLMHLLAGKFVEVHFWSMAWDTTKVVIIPIVAGLLFNSFFRGRVKWLDKLMPLLSMTTIVLIIVVIISAGRDNLLNVGGVLVLALFIHNVTGYTLGYWISRLLGFKEKDCRTISLEVGMQNSGLASGLALLMGGVATIGLAPAIFGPVMNISGSTLATWWHGKPPEDTEANESKLETEVNPL